MSGQKFTPYIASNYFLTPWGAKLKAKYIFDNPSARCWLCGKKVLVWVSQGRKKSNLLLHHVRYDHLGSERLYTDLIILCIDCHDQAHYWFGHLYRVPRKHHQLIQRLYFLKGKNCFQSKQFGLSALFYFLFSLY